MSRAARSTTRALQLLLDTLNQRWRRESLGAVGADVDRNGDLPHDLAFPRDLEDARLRVGILDCRGDQDIAIFESISVTPVR